MFPTSVFQSAYLSFGSVSLRVFVCLCVCVLERLSLYMRAQTTYALIAGSGG